MNGAKNLVAWLTCFISIAFSGARAEPAAPLVIGDTYTLQSKVLGETRRINVYLPPGYADAPAVTAGSNSSCQCC